MSVLKHIVTAGGGLALALMAPMIALQAQVVAPGTNPRSPTTNPAPTNPTPTTNPTTPTPTTQVDITTDLLFIQEAASANLMEVSLGRIAQSRGARPGVKEFGGRMVSDHTSLQQQLTTMASNNGVALSPALQVHQQQEISRLQTLSGDEFDRAYIQLMIQEHQKDVNRFQSESRSNPSAPVGNLITSSLPVLQQDLSLAQELGRQLNLEVATPSKDKDRLKDEERASQANIRADAKFIRDVDAHHFLQIRLGRLAQDKARDGDVKRFGKQMEEDHSAFLKQWNNMASRNGMKFKSGMGKEHRADLEMMEKMVDQDFDRAYMSLMIQNHNAYLNYWRREGRAARSAPVRQLVNRGIPTLEEHMAEAKRLGKRVGVNIDAALAGRRIAADR